MCLLTLVPLTSGCFHGGWRVLEAGVAAGAAIANLAAEAAQGAPRDDDEAERPPSSVPPPPVCATPPAPSTSTAPCGECVIDDIADANGQIVIQDGRDGYWYTFVDRTGTTVSPPAGHPFIQSPGGTHGLQYAAHMRGKVSASGAPGYAAMGFNFMNPRAAYDASKYTGVSFYARVGARSQTRVRLSMPDVDTDPQGSVCTACSNDFGVDLELTDQWRKFTLGFAQMRQLDGWGSPQPDQIDDTKLYGMQWQVNEPGASYDVWVSDIRFTPYEALGQPL